MKFQKRVLKFEFDGTNYELKFPTVKQILNFQKNSEGNEDYSATFSFLNDLGLPENVSEEMEVNHLVTIMNKLTDREEEE